MIFFGLAGTPKNLILKGSGAGDPEAQLAGLAGTPMGSLGPRGPAGSRVDLGGPDRPGRIPGLENPGAWGAGIPGSPGRI